MKLPFAQVDAFADRPFTGNPAAVMMVDIWYADEILQAIAEENNLAETAFLIGDPTRQADYHLRWFTPTTEVALCGHATLASAHMILSHEPNLERVTFRTEKSGMLEVSREGAGYAMALPTHRAEPKPLPEILAALGLESAAATLWHEKDYALIVVEDAETVAALAPDFRALGALGDVLTIVTAPGTTTDVVSRVFAPGAGIDEDPVTGSAHTVLAPYWAERLGRDRFTAYQASRRGGLVDCELSSERTILRGTCVTVIEGIFAFEC
ncbi:PhzF family phenazine biosynthesis protein [Nostoc sp. 3335mG]|nr:PhzF family phenazine biosynthesis protein [Nostoc sp. 3335mG]